jgi:hypothetical protein
MTKYILMTLALVTTVGCGGGGDTLSEQQTMQALTAIGSAAGLGFSAANGQVEQGAQGQVTVNATANCLNGGSVAAGGRVTVNTTSEQFSYDLGLTFASCKVGSLTMDGSIDVAGSGGSGQFSLSLDGRVTFSGDISGTCVFDLNQSYDQATGRFVYNGRACGRSVNVEINTGG